MKAAQFVNIVLQGKPELVVHQSDLPATAAALCNLFAATGCFFERDTPVKMVRCADGGLATAVPLTVNSVVVEAHRASVGR